MVFRALRRKLQAIKWNIFPSSRNQAPSTKIDDGDDELTTPDVAVPWMKERPTSYSTIRSTRILGNRKENIIVCIHACVLAASAILLLLSLEPLQASDSISFGKHITSLQHEVQPGKDTNSTRMQFIDVIHDEYHVPYRLLEPLSVSHLEQLLSLLREPLSKIAPLPKRRVLFAQINGSDIWDRTRALASVMAYSRTTDRVGVVIWYVHDGFHSTFDQLYQWKCESSCPPIVVVSRNESDGRITDSLHDHDDFADEFDWAEYSVRELAMPTPRNDSSFDTTGEIALKLNEFAPRDLHISFSLSSAIRSRYSSLINCEDLIHRLLRGKTYMAKIVMQSAHLVVKKTHTFSNRRVRRVLHHYFDIPFMLLDSLRPNMLRILLDRLLEKRRNGEMQPRTVWVQPQYGLGNRLRALGSVMAFAEQTNRVLVLVWVADAHMNCRFDELFVGHDGIMVSDGFSSDETWPFTRQFQKDPAMHAVEWYNYMRARGIHIHKPSEMVEDYVEKHVYISSAYVVLSKLTSGIARTQSAHWKVLAKLTPVIATARLVESAQHRFMRGTSAARRNVMGVHIRGKPLDADVKGVLAQDYAFESANRTSYWRNLTNVAVFIEEMKLQKQTQQFYVAADSREALELVDHEFPGRVTYTSRKCDSRSRDCVPYALADIILLGQCATIRGSYWSSFTELACRWSGAPYRLAGINFGRPI